MLDLPQLLHPESLVSIEFFKELSKLDNLALFDYHCIRAIISLRWKQCFRFILVFQMIPYIAFLTIYQLYSIGFNYNKDEEKKGLILTQTLLIIFSVWFILFEVYQVYKNGRHYLSDWWNLVDVLPPCCIVFLVIMEIILSD